MRRGQGGQYQRKRARASTTLLASAMEGASASQGKGILPWRPRKDCSLPTPDEASETHSDPQGGREKQRSGRESERIGVDVEKQGLKMRRKGRVGRLETVTGSSFPVCKELCDRSNLTPTGFCVGVNAPTLEMRKSSFWVVKSLS